MARRHDSLIPLSHQHQHALALTVIIRRRFGIEKGEQAWRDEQIEKIQKAWTAELKGHFEVEEGLLFPEMERYLGKIRLVDELLRDHGSLRGLIRLIETSSDYALLDGFGALLESHVHKEERELFAEFEKKMPVAEALKLGREIEARLAKVCPNL
ncbi:MAG: hemerythrin domain-containing protein [Terriglobia bacterium]